MTDMNEMIRARRASKTFARTTEPGPDPAYVAAAWRAHLDAQHNPTGPTFGKRTIAGLAAPTLNEQMRRALRAVR